MHAPFYQWFANGVRTLLINSAWFLPWVALPASSGFPVDTSQTSVPDVVGRSRFDFIIYPSISAQSAKEYDNGDKETVARAYAGPVASPIESLLRHVDVRSIFAIHGRPRLRLVGCVKHSKPLWFLLWDHLDLIRFCLLDWKLTLLKKKMVRVSYRVSLFDKYLRCLLARGGGGEGGIWKNNLYFLAAQGRAARQGESYTHFITLLSPARGIMGNDVNRGGIFEMEKRDSVFGLLVKV